MCNIMEGKCMNSTKRIISISNEKGGVGKTTTALCLAEGLRAIKRKVLIVDMDPQCNSTTTYGATIDDTYTMVDILRKNCSAKEAIQTTEMGDIIPNDPVLKTIEAEFAAKPINCFLLNSELSKIEDYDYIILDTPPHTSFYTICSWIASGYIIIPIQSEIYSIDGLSGVIASVREATEMKEQMGQSLTILGVLQTKFDKRNSIDQEIHDSLPSILSDMDLNMFKTTIRTSQDVKKAQKYRENLLEKYPNSNASKDYKAFVKEVEKEIRKYEK